MPTLGHAVGYPDYSSAGAGQYTPQIYAQKTLIKFYKATFLTEICNTDYEGSIKAQGDKVIIRTVPDITINDYLIGQDIVYNTYDSASITLEINQAKYYAFKIENITALQNDIDQMGKWTDDAAEQLKITIETSFLIDLFKTNQATTCSAYNRGVITSGLSGGAGAYVLGTDLSNNPAVVKNPGAASLTDINAVDLIMGAEAALTERNVPQDSDRWIIIPTWLGFMLQTGDLRRADSNGTASQDVLRNGKIGRLGQFNVYVSNNLPTATTATGATVIPFGHKSGLTFATQMTDTETMPHPTNFGKILRSLQVYGYKAVKSEALGCIIAKK
jgi:hypothetical protein